MNQRQFARNSPIAGYVSDTSACPLLFEISSSRGYNRRLRISAAAGISSARIKRATVRLGDLCSGRESSSST
jgi:hypothetical protein